MSIPVITIAGFNAGIPVTINAELFHLYHSMKQSAINDNHWARICVSELKALTSGHIRKNVYVQCNGNHEEFGEYTIILPGCKASFRKNNTGKYYIYALEADVNYGQSQKSFKKPALFYVKKTSTKWQAEITNNGKIEKRNITIVAVSDQLDGIDDALSLAPDALIESTRIEKSYLEDYGFDLHFTPGNHRIGGLRVLQAARAQTDARLHESAILLAGTMESAMKIEGVTWVSERGGSGVLTQAMRILKERGVNFEQSKHKVFFSNIQTNLGCAEQLARDIKLGFPSKTHSKDWYNISHQLGSGLLNGYASPIRRRFKDDKYSTLNMLSDIKDQVKDHQVAYYSAAGVGTGALGLYSSAAAVGAAAATALSSPGLMFSAAVTAGGACVAAYKGTAAVAKSYFPLAYKKKIKGD